MHETRFVMEEIQNSRQKSRRIKKPETKMVHNSLFQSSKLTKMGHNSLFQSPKLSPGQDIPKALHMSRFATRSSCTNSIYPKKQVCLYNWSLIRVGGDHPENDSIGNGKLVALEGYTTSDLNDHDKFTTAPIESRIEKLKLRTVDGMDILLKSRINEQHSFENGFPWLVIHLFLTGFPYNWSNVLSTHFGQSSLEGSVLPASKEKESVWQENGETQISGCTEICMKNMGTGKSSEAEEKIIEVEEKLSKVTSGESLAKGRKRGRNHFQPIRSSKRLKCGNLSINSERKVSTPLVGSVDNSDHTRTIKTKRKDMNKDQIYLCVKDYKNFERDDHLPESDTELLRRKSPNFPVSQEDKDAVKCKANIVYDFSRSMKETREEDETQISGCTKIRMMNMGTGKSSLLEAEEKTIEVEEKLSKVTSGESLARCRKRGIDSSQPIRSSDRLKCGNSSLNSEPQVCTPLVEPLNDCNHNRSVKSKRKDITNDQMHLCSKDNKKFEKDDHLTESDSKLLRRKTLNFSVSQEDKGLVKCKENVVYDVLRSMEETRESEKRIESETEQSPLVSVHLQHLENNCTPGGEQTQKTQMPLSECGQPIPLDTPLTKRNRIDKSVRLEITDEAFKKASRVEHEICSDNIICTKASAKTCKRNILYPPDSEFTTIPNETCLSSSAENKPFPLPENHLNSNVTQCVKYANNLDTKRRVAPRTRSRCTDQPPKLSDAFLCHQTNLNDSVMLKCNNIIATCSTTSYKEPSTIHHGTGSENHTEISENSPKANDNGEGSMQTPKTRRELNVQIKTKKRQLLNNMLLTPPHRVHTTPEEVSKAFGLKTSRSGRLLVPPLAHWCNQTIAYDMDGGIIAILDASSERDKSSGSSIFMPPEQKDAMLIREKLCNAANESTLTLRSARKACKN